MKVEWLNGIIYEIKMYKNMIQDTMWILKHIETLCTTYMPGRTVCIKNGRVLTDCISWSKMPEELWQIDGIVQFEVPYRFSGHLGKIHFTWKWDNANLFHQISWYRAKTAPFSHGIWKFLPAGGNVPGGHWMHRHICIKAISE